jgi:hypothetical protein
LLQTELSGTKRPKFSELRYRELAIARPRCNPGVLNVSPSLLLGWRAAPPYVVFLSEQILSWEWIRGPFEIDARATSGTI